jgi:hypothetical protein
MGKKVKLGAAVPTVAANLIALGNSTEFTKPISLQACTIRTYLSLCCVRGGAHGMGG